MTPGRVATFQWSIPGLEEQSNSMTLAVGIKSPLIAGHFRAIIVPKMSTAGNTGVFFENAGSDPVFLNLRLKFYLLWSFVKLKDRLFEKYNPTIKITKSTFFSITSITLRQGSDAFARRSPVPRWLLQSSPLGWEDFLPLDEVRSRYLDENGTLTIHISYQLYTWVGWFHSRLSRLG